MLLGIGAIAVALFLSATQAHAVRVTLKRVEFEGGNRSEVITIINNSNKVETYRMGWKRMRMTPDKALVNVADDDPAPDLSPAEPYIRFSPRRVTVKPGEAQQIRLMVRYPKDLPDGEYRSHFWIHQEAAARDFDESLTGDSKTKQAVVLEMLTGITMPVFIRKGKLEVSIAIENLTAKLNGDFVIADYTLKRTGTKSAYGDMEFICTGGSKDLSLDEVRGVAMYTDVDHRNVTTRFKAPEGGLQACPNLKVVYREEGADGKVLDTKTVKLER